MANCWRRCSSGAYRLSHQANVCMSVSLWRFYNNHAMSWLLDLSHREACNQIPPWSRHVSALVVVFIAYQLFVNMNMGVVLIIIFAMQWALECSARTDTADVYISCNNIFLWLNVLLLLLYSKQFPAGTVRGVIWGLWWLTYGGKKSSKIRGLNAFYGQINPRTCVEVF